MEIIEIKTLIDITNTNINRPSKEKEKEFNQYKNWTTLLQCIGLRSIISYESNPSNEVRDIKNLGFGTKFKGKHRVWTFRFVTDRNHSYLDSKGAELGFLVADLHEVPVIKNLNETINIEKPIFDLSDDTYKNTLIRKVEEDLET
jgi:hypothetical protein